MNPPKPVEQKRLTVRSATRDAGGRRLPQVVVLAASSTVSKPPGSLGDAGVRCGAHVGCWSGVVVG